MIAYRPAARRAERTHAPSPATLAAVAAALLQPLPMRPPGVAARPMVQLALPWGVRRG